MNEELRKIIKKILEEDFFAEKYFSNPTITHPVKSTISYQDKDDEFIEPDESFKEVISEKEKGLWANIHAKRKRGEAPAKPGDDDYPDKKSWEKAKKSENKEHEGASYKISLKDIEDMSKEIGDAIEVSDNLPYWVQDKITIANHNMKSILDYMRTNDISKMYENWSIPMKIKEGVNISEDLKYHIDNKIPLGECVFRYGSEKYFDVIKEVKSLYENGDIFLNENDEFIILENNLDTVKLMGGESVYLDFIYEYTENINEAEYRGRKVELNKPKRGGSKKFYVYVRDPKTKNVRKISFGAQGGGGNLAVKLKDPEARKAFAKRHDCENKNDKMTPGYWSCRLPRYAKSLGLSGGGRWW